MTLDQTIRDLYASAELLQRSYTAMDLAGHTEAARQTREAAVCVMHAIAALVRQRAEQGVVS